MATRCSFKQSDVGDNWDLFANTAKEFGFNVRVTGGSIHTHEIDCSLADFRLLVDLVRNTKEQPK